MLRFLLFKKSKNQKKNLKSPDGINLQKIQFMFGFLLFSATLFPSAPNTGTLLSGALSTLSLCILPLACIGCVVQWLDTANFYPGHHLTEVAPRRRALVLGHWSLNFH